MLVLYDVKLLYWNIITLRLTIYTNQKYELEAYCSDKYLKKSSVNVVISPLICKSWIY